MGERNALNVGPPRFHERMKALANRKPDGGKRAEYLIFPPAQKLSDELDRGEGVKGKADAMRRVHAIEAGSAAKRGAVGVRDALTGKDGAKEKAEADDRRARGAAQNPRK
jgi:hypothetical protein